MSVVEGRHVSVLPQETLGLLAPRPGETWVDATVGAGGHSRLIAEQIAPNGLLIGIDQDLGMLQFAQSRLENLPVRLIHANFDQLTAVLKEVGRSQVDGLLADLGFCSDQMDNANRGLSFQQDGPLDMRLNQELGATAADIIARTSEFDLARIFWEYGEERHSRRVAKRIVETRGSSPIHTTNQLADLVRSVVPRDFKSRIDPATRVFQALRIEVNDELGALDRLLDRLPHFISPGGRVGIISFHSLEDRRVKQAFQDRTIWENITRKPVQASDEEMHANPRSRSAKLRVARRMTWPTKPNQPPV